MCTSTPTWPLISLVYPEEGKSIFDPGDRRTSDKFHADVIRLRWDENYADHFDEYGYNQGRVVCVNDDKDLFLHLLRTRPNHINYDHLRTMLFQYDCINCVTAIIDGQNEGQFDFRLLIYGFDEEVTPIKFAAGHGAHRLINLFIDRGCSDDVNIRDSQNNLPLNEALDPMTFWMDPTESIYDGICAICEWDHRPLMETSRILAHLTKDVQQEFIKYAMEGSVIEVATLLLVAREKVMPSCLDLRKQILEKIISLLVDDVRSVLTSGSDYLTQKRMFLQVTLALFDIFEKVGEQLLAILCLPKEDFIIRSIVAGIFEGAGFSVDNVRKFASDLSYRSLSELFMDQRLTSTPSALKRVHEGHIPDGSVNGLEGHLNPKVQGQLEGSIIDGDSHELVNSMFFASELLRSICYHNSVECARALLEDKTALKIELNIPVEDGMYPLHLSAISLSPSLTELFLCHGARTNVQLNNTSSPYHGMFPLELALEALCRHRYVGDWMPTKSIYKLIYIFCLPELMGPLKTIELLATDISVVQKISSLCVQEGKLVELSALLMVSWDKLVLPGHGSDIRSSFIGKHIVRELHMLLDEESKLICSKDTDGVKQFRRKKGVLLFALSMLELLKSARSAIQAHRLFSKLKNVANFEVPLDVSNLLRELGFFLKNDDIDVNDIKCLLPQVKSQQSDMAIGSVTDGAHVHLAKSNIAPQPSDSHGIYDDRVYFPMHLGGGLCSLKPQARQIPKRAVTNFYIGSKQPKGVMFNNLARQSSIPRSATYRSWYCLASAAKRYVRCF